MVDYVDLTEPATMEIGAAYVTEDNYLWFVELYLMSKYQPDMVEATIFKIRQAAFERAKIVKEDHLIHQSLEGLENAIIMDLAANVQWTPQRSHHVRGSKTPTPGIGSAYQRELENL